MTLAQRISALAATTAEAGTASIAELAAALGFDPAALVDGGTQQTIAAPAPGLERARFVPARDGEGVAYVALDVADDQELAIDELAAIFGEGNRLPVLPGGPQQPVDFGAVVAYTEGDAVRSLVLHPAPGAS